MLRERFPGKGYERLVSDFRPSPKQNLPVSPLLLTLIIACPKLLNQFGRSSNNYLRGRSHEDWGGVTCNDRREIVEGVGESKQSLV
jgi:hypothetical protein